MKLCMMSCMLNTCPVEEIVQCAADCAMEAIDWIALHDRKPEYLKKISLDAGLRIACHTMIKYGFLHRKNNYKDEFKASLEDTVIMGAPILMLPPFGRMEQSGLEEARKEWIEYYAWAAPLAKGAGVQLTVEPTGMPDSPIVTGEELKEVLDAVPDLMLTFDHGNMATGGGDAVKEYLLLKDRIVHFHLKDWHIRPEPFEGGTLKRCGKYFGNAMIGTGDLDLQGFWNQLDEKTRNCHVNLESIDFTGHLSGVESTKRLAAMLRSW